MAKEMDILRALKDQRVTGNDSFFNTERIKGLLKVKGVSVSHVALYYNIMRLLDKGLLEANNKWPKGFRFKKI